MNWKLKVRYKSEDRDNFRGMSQINILKLMWCLIRGKFNPLNNNGKHYITGISSMDNKKI